MSQQHRRPTNSGKLQPARESSLQLLEAFSYMFRIDSKSYATTSP